MQSIKRINDEAIVSARWVFPIGSKPIRGGWIRIHRDQVVDIGEGSPPSSSTDLGDVAIFPALVNAHTHLEFSDCSSPIGNSGIPLHQWIGQVVASRQQRDINDTLIAIEQGIAESVAAGVGLIGEIATPPNCYPDSPAIPIVKFAEVIGLSESRGRERMDAAILFNQKHRDGAWSPHAPYSTSIDLIRHAVKQSQSTRKPLAMHVAETPEERELLETGQGGFACTLSQMGVLPDGMFPWKKADPISSLIGLLLQSERLLLIHGNDLQEREIGLLAGQPHCTVVYCPRTHHFFGHQRHPVATLRAHGVRVALGTDSRASNPDLNLWKEVQFLLRHRSDLNPADVIEMATIAGAEALGKERHGRIEPGSQAHFGTVKTMATNVEDVFVDCVSQPLRPLRLVTG